MCRPIDLDVAAGRDGIALGHERVPAEADGLALDDGLVDEPAGLFAQPVAVVERPGKAGSSASRVSLASRASSAASRTRSCPSIASSRSPTRPSASALA
jgi:hypothetical protein